MSQETIRAAERAAGQVNTMSTYDPDSDQLHEECGIFGVWAPDRDVARLTYFGLRALQHRGQESAGIAVGDGGTVMVRKDLGLLDRVFSNADLSTLSGQLAVGHVRYGTAGAKSWEASQPHLSTINSVIIALAHNGTLVNTDELRRQLIELGVPFPRNRYGEYIGYKTDHDPRRRATSVGPYTSKQMTECLERAVLAKGVPILDKTQVIKILADSGTVCGLLCLNTAAQDAADRFTLIRCKNVIWATGGPAGMYADSVYPFSQYGATGLALEAGARGKNLTEWQYGLASVALRWNVSGTYMQVLPRVYSTAADGSDEREFLMDFFSDVHDMLSNLFLKGYQWPFDVRKIADGSSIIDILVYQETCKGRRVYLDYRTNPVGGAFTYDALLPEAREYLTCAGACFGTPIERLAQMNQPAIDFYRDKGVDLYTQPLEIALCAQHNNGGIGIDCWWQTDVKGLFAVGEAAASHGVYRPGGRRLVQ